jgi:tRNA G37 N-methylase TrmD
MLVIKSDLNLLDRMSVDYSTDLLNSGVQGTWCTIDANNKAVITTTSGAAGLSFAVFSESNADGTQGWAPDVAASGKVTLLSGTYRAVTDQISEATYDAVSVGDALAAGDGGKLIAAPATAAGAMALVGWVKRKYTTYAHRGASYTKVIEYVTR